MRSEAGACGCVVVGAWSDDEAQGQLARGPVASGSMDGRAHVSAFDSEQSMVRMLRHAADAIARVAPLETGYLRDVHGTLHLERKAALSPSRPVFFRATDASITLFDTVQ